jgi:hypothetical protein
MRPNSPKPWTQLTLEELRSATRKFDKQIPFSATRSLTALERARFERARHRQKVVSALAFAE